VGTSKRKHPGATHGSVSRDREDRLNLLSEALENVQDFVKVVDATPAERGGPRIVYVNGAVLAASGYSENEIVGKRYDVAYSPKNSRAVLDAIEKTIASGGMSAHEVLIRRKNGSDFWIEFVDQPFVNRRGEPMRISIGRDITLRKRAFNEISLLLASLEQSHERIALYEIDQAGELALVFQNERAKAFGRTRLLELLAADDDLAKAIRRKLDANTESSYAFVEPDGEGSPSVVQFTAHAVRNGERIEAVLTRERVLTHAPAGSTESSPLLRLAVMVPALRQAATSAERLAVLRALLLDRFEAETTVEKSVSALGVRFDRSGRSAVFPYDGASVVVTWPNELEERSITAMRFCIETALDLERIRR
jgi:PAS domain S-box-containing protein